mmetsp:Transcript_5342/g.15243  ORF Transcript_5342/g.15243 Transcript_5342/m.15243 type:complete len:256 (-) Transcript_5342:170-937(-)
MLEEHAVHAHDLRASSEFDAQVRGARTCTSLLVCLCNVRQYLVRVRAGSLRVGLHVFTGGLSIMAEGLVREILVLGPGATALDNRSDDAGCFSLGAETRPDALAIFPTGSFSSDVQCYVVGDSVFRGPVVVVDTLCLFSDWRSMVSRFCAHALCVDALRQITRHTSSHTHAVVGASGHAVGNLSCGCTGHLLCPPGVVAPEFERRENGRNAQEPTHLREDCGARLLGVALFGDGCRVRVPRIPCSSVVCHDVKAL